MTLRRTPLKRTPMRRKARSTSYSRRPRDIDYMRSVRGLPCLLSGVDGAGKCSGHVEADHAGERGLGQKADDSTCISLCEKHHRERTDVRGYFASLEREGRRRWIRWAIGRTQLLVAEKRTGVARPEGT